MSKRNILLVIATIYALSGCTISGGNNRSLLISYLNWDKESVEILYETGQDYLTEYDMVKINAETGERKQCDKVSAYFVNAPIVADPIDSELTNIDCYYFQRNADSTVYWGIDFLSNYLFRYSRRLKTKDCYPVTCFNEIAVNWSNEHIFLINDYDKASMFSVQSGIYFNLIKGDTVLTDYEISSFKRTDFVEYNGKSGWMINLSYVYLPSTVLENGILFVPDDTSSMLMMRNKSGVFSEDCSMRAVYKVVDGILHLFIYDKEDSIVRDETP